MEVAENTKAVCTSFFKVQAAFVNTHICYFYRCVLYVENNRVVYMDSLSSYDKLDVSGFIHYRINHSKEFTDRQNHINGIENFWNQAKRVLRKYNGIDRKFFPLFLKECEFRFNFGTPSRQLKILRDWCGI